MEQYAVGRQMPLGNLLSEGESLQFISSSSRRSSYQRLLRCIWVADHRQHPSRPGIGGGWLSPFHYMSVSVVISLSKVPILSTLKILAGPRCWDSLRRPGMHGPRIPLSEGVSIRNVSAAFPVGRNSPIPAPPGDTKSRMIWDALPGTPARLVWSRSKTGTQSLGASQSERR